MDTKSPNVLKCIVRLQENANKIIESLIAKHHQFYLKTIKLMLTSIIALLPSSIMNLTLIIIFCHVKDFKCAKISTIAGLRRGSSEERVVSTLVFNHCHELR